jgi:hypothetical protein
VGGTSMRQVWCIHGAETDPSKGWHMMQANL